jgi:hypothetical protein|tara:strand:+ start:1938 stop:3074 length:1137 start_codon:yes stop_codon:yes gene_type:complete
MASSYENDLRLEEMGTGEQIGSWGTTTNTNLSLIAEAFSYQTEATFDANANKEVTIQNGQSDKRRAFYLKVTSSATLDATRTLTILPNTVSKVIFIENATSGGQSISISQGSGASVTIANGKTKGCGLDGGGSGAVVHDLFEKIDLGASATFNGGAFVTASSTDTLTNKTIDSDSNTITNIVNADIKATAQIDATKIADGSVTSAEFQYINTLSSNAQTQLNNAYSSSDSNLTLQNVNEVRRGASATGIKNETDHIEFYVGSTERATLDNSGNFTADGNVSAYSDLALKEDIYQIENALDKVKKLRGVHFTRKENKSKEIGVVANEVERVVPELVNEHEDKELGTVKSMKYANTVGLLIEAIKDLSKEVEDLKNGSTN